MRLTTETRSARASVSLWFMAVLLLSGGVAANPVSPTRTGCVRLADVVASSETRLPYLRPHAPVPVDLPLPPAVAVTASSRAFVSPQGARGAAAARAPEIVQSFEAVSDNDTAVPPDTNGAAGPYHLMVLLNSEIRIQDRSGRTLHAAATSDFFESVRSGGVFDPHVMYDARNGRWIASAVSDQKTTAGTLPTASAILLAISRGSDPLESWDLYRLDADASGQFWFDFPQLGYDDGSIVITANLYTVNDSRLEGVSVFVADRSGSLSFSRFDVRGGGAMMTPTVSYDGPGTTYLVQRWNGNAAGGGRIRLYSVSSSGVVPLAFPASSINWSSQAPVSEFAPQAGTARRIDNGDDRILSAVVRNGTIWTAHTVFLPAGTPTRSSVQWWQLSREGAVVQRGLIDDPAGGAFYAFPSIAVNRRNDVVVGCTRFSASTAASAFFASRTGDDPPDLMSAAVVFKPGEAPYFKLKTSAINRWGDYSATSVDPLNDTDFWTIQEYAASPLSGVDRWGTWWARIQTSPDVRRRSTRH